MTEPFRSFKRQFHKVRKVVDTFGEAGSFSLSLSWNGTQTRSELTTPDKNATVRLAILMRPFLSQHSPLHYEVVWQALRDELATELPAGTEASIEAAIQHLKVGSVGFVYNERRLTTEELYDLLAEGEYFNTDEAAAQYLREIFEVPFAGHFIWLQFYDYTLAGFALVRGLFELLRHVEQSERYKELYPTTAADTRCIYCLTTIGAFTSEEHIVPESLGNDELVLPVGYACDQCNSTLASLDSYLSEFEPLALLQVQFVSFTKAGKLPQARFQNVHIRRTGPRSIHFIPQDKSGEMQQTAELGEGWFAWNFNIRGKRTNFIKLSQSLYKVGLALVALGDGQDVVCSERYDAARAFIRTGKDMPNPFLVRTTIKPVGRVHVGYTQEYGGTLVQLDFYGFICLLNLESQPIIKLNDQLAEASFELWPPR